MAGATLGRLIGTVILQGISTSIAGLPIYQHERIARGIHSSYEPINVLVESDEKEGFCYSGKCPCIPNR